jgi:hypothetical protein
MVVAACDECLSSGQLLATLKNLWKPAPPRSPSDSVLLLLLTTALAAIIRQDLGYAACGLATDERTMGELDSFSQVLLWMGVAWF